MYKSRHTFPASPDTAGIKVTLSESQRALKTRAKEFLDHVAGDLELIETQERKEEILVEYRHIRNVSTAVTIVNNRHKAMEAERQRREAAFSAATYAAFAESGAKAEEIADEAAARPGLMPPVEIPVEGTVSPEQAAEKLYSTAFRVTGSLDQLRALKKFLIDGGYAYEQL